MNKYALTGASFPMHINDKEFAACSLSDKDYVELDGYIQSKVLEVVRPSLDALTAVERNEVLQAAVKAAASSGWGTPEGMRIINTQEGMLRLGWQMLRKKQPGLSFEGFKSLADKDIIKNLLEIDKCFSVLNLDDEVEKIGNSEEGSSDEPKSN